MEFREYRVLQGRVDGSFGGKVVAGKVGDMVLLPPADGDELAVRGIVVLDSSKKQADPVFEIEVAPPALPPVLTPEPPMVKAPDPKININTCTAEELESLPNIGASTAKAIIRHRPFASVEEVPGKASLGGIVKANWYQVAPLIEVLSAPAAVPHETPESEQA